MTGSFTLLILPVIVLISPIILSLAARQEKKVKQKLRYIFQISLVIIAGLAFLNWETQNPGGRNAFALASDFKSIFLWLFLGITFSQIIILHLKTYKFDVLATIGNVFATFIFFASAITISNALGQSLVSPAIITVAMTVLINNVIGLVLVNKDPNLLSKFPLSQESVNYAKQHKIRQTGLQKFLTWAILAILCGFLIVTIFLI